MRKDPFVAVLIAVALALSPIQPARAQSTAQSVRIATLVDYDSTTETFCALAVADSQGPGPVSAAASNTVTSSAAFTNVAAGDELVISQGTNRYLVGVSARASDSSLTAAYRDPVTLASQTLTFTGATFRHRKLVCGTGANAGAFAMAGGPWTIQVTVYTMTATTVKWRIQCRADVSAGWNQIYPVLVPPATTATTVDVTAAATGGYTVSSVDPAAECRVGVTMDTDGAGAEQISIVAIRRAS